MSIKMRTSNFGSIGAGNLAQCLIKGLISSECIQSKRIWASAPIKKDVEDAAKLGCHVTNNNLDVLKQTNMVGLLVKPQVLQKVLIEIAPHITKNHIILSFAAGVPLTLMKNSLPEHAKVFRVMTNLPIKFCQGVSTYTTDINCNQDDKNKVHSLLSSLGYCTEVEENLMDTITASAGAGPAYGYYFIEAMADAMVLGGINRKDAFKMAAKSLLGAAKMVEVENVHPSILKDNVCSAGGVTINGLSTLEEKGAKGAIIKAITNATAKSKDLRLSLNEQLLDLQKLQSSAQKRSLPIKRFR